jgi:hypothetical protein
MSRSYALLIVISLFLGVPSVAGDGTGARHVDGLKSEDVQERLKTAQAITDERNAVITELLAFLKRDWDDTYRGSTHLAIEKLGECRSRQGASLLARKIDWELTEESMQQMWKYPPWIRFPCAVALKNIGGQEVRYEVYKEMPKRTDERSLMLMAWVLQGIDGPEVAEMILEQKRQNEAENAELQQTLGKVITYVKQGDGVFANFRR